MRGKELIDTIVGKKINNLMIICRTDIKGKGGNYKFKCICDCGKEVNRIWFYIKNNNGCEQCLRKLNKGKNHVQYTGYEEISRTYWSRVISNANLRKLSVTITIEEAYHKFITQNKKCALSNLDISFSNKTASLDRIDSLYDYSKENTQWLHKDVNTMKWNLKQEYFIEMCKKVVECQKSTI